MRRVVVKVGSSSLVAADGGLSRPAMASLVGQIAGAAKQADVILVTSGAVATGFSRLKWHRGRVTMPEKQAAAAVGQSILIGAYDALFSTFGLPVAQLLLTRADIEDRRRFTYIRNTLDALIKHGIVPIINENDTVTTEEIRVGDNDTLAALVALAAGADLLVLLTDADGLYTQDPALPGGGEKLDEVWEISEKIRAFAGAGGSAVGTGGMRTKLQAAQIATESGIEVVIAKSGREGTLRQAIEGLPVGTRFHASKVRRPKRKLWLAHGARSEGRLVVDMGAGGALRRSGVSLLLPGVLSVEGSFLEGSIVDIDDEQGTAVGRGVVRLSSADLAMLLAERAKEAPARLGQEVVHRDDMVVFEEGGTKGELDGRSDAARP